MTSRAQNDLKRLPGFSVTGWHRNTATEVWVDTQADILLARKIIATEVREFKSSLNDLDARLEHNSEHYKKVEKSKQRKLFDLKVTQIDRSPRVGFNQPSSPLKGPAATLMSGTFVQWLNQNYPAKALLIASKTAATSYLSAPQPVALNLAIHLVVDGDGNIEPSSSMRPDRYRISKDSLANWIATTEPSERAHAVGYAIGPQAAAALLELFRFRLAPHQFVALVDGTPAAAIMLNEWDGDIELTDDQVLIFTNPGSRFLDPLNAPDTMDCPFPWPKISVVTVSYNQESFLEDCICSILDQDYPNLEYIVIDAESTDGSQEILRKYEDRFATLRIEKDNGQSEGLNKGLDLATGDILTWLNSDDMLTPGSLKRAAIAFMQYDCDMIVGGCERITTDSREVTLLHHPALPFGRKVPLGFVEQLIWSKSWGKGDYFYQPEVMFSAEIWRRSGGYLKDHLYWAMDWELWIRMAMAGATIVHIPDTIGRSRKHPDQKTTSAELYLYQLKNILIEHDEALKQMESLAVNLPPGRISQWPPTPTWSTLCKQLITKTWQSLQRKNQRFKNSKVIKRLKKYRDPEKLNNSIQRHFTKIRDKGKSPNTTMDPSSHQNLLKAERKIASLQAQIELLTVRDQELTNETSSSHKKIQALTDAIAEYASQQLFGVTASNERRKLVHREVEAGTPIEVILRKKVSNAENGLPPTTKKIEFDMSDDVKGPPR